VQCGTVMLEDLVHVTVGLKPVNLLF
jgi:hypothetical protein